MSRGTALAYAPQPATRPTQDAWPGRGDTAAYALLLGQDELFGGPRLLQVEEDAEPAFDGLDYLEEQAVMPASYYAPQEPDQSLRRPLVSPKLLVGLVVAALLALALMLVTPVLASGHFGFSSRPGSLSHYSELTAGASAPVPPVGEVDTTSAPGAAAPQQAPSSAPALAYSLVAPPSISVSQIETVLAKYGSPAVGQGQLLYDLGVRYGIDPSYALAFFVHESGCGTRGVARFTHSLGNIRWTEGYDNYEGYRSYSSWQEGMEDWYKLITDLYINGWGLRTVDAIVPVYAPAGDGNNPPAYSSSVKAMVDSWRGK